MEHRDLSSEQQTLQKQKRYLQRRQWALEHPEQRRQYGRDFYWRNREKRRAYSIAYYHAHKAERSAYAKEYYRRKKAADPNYVKKMNDRACVRRREIPSEQQRGQPARAGCDPWALKAENYRKTINEYAYRSMAAVRAQFAERVAQYLLRYPFDEYGQTFIRSVLCRYHIYSNRGEYADCYEAGMLAYLYSIHRCAAMNCNYVVPYIRKMIRIYVVCALVIFRDAQNLCRANGMREVRLDADAAGRLY